MAEMKECDTGCDHEEKEEGESRFEEKNNRKVGFFRINTHVPEVVVNISSGDAGKHFGDTDQVLGHGEENGRVRHPGNEVMRNAGGSIGLGEKEVSVLGNLYGGHTAGIYGIADPDEGKGNHDDGGEPEGVRDEMTQTFLPDGRGLGEGVEDNKETKDGEDEEGREFGELGEAESHTCKENHLWSRVLEKPDKAIKGEEDEGSTSEIGRHIVVVSDDIGVKGVEGEGEKASQYPTKGTSPQEKPESEEDRENDDREAREEENRIGVVTGHLWSGAVDEHITHEPLFVVAGLPSVGFERKVEAEREEKQPGEIFDERWMFGIETHVAIADVAIGSWDMGSFIIGHGLLGRDHEGEDEVREENKEYKKDGVLFDELHRV